MFRPLLLLAACALILPAATARAETPTPLRLIPPIADAVVQVENPRRLVEALLKNDAYTRLASLDAARAYIDTPAVRNFLELVGYFERELGAPWPTLLDKLAGGGMAVGIKYDGKDRPPTLLVIQGTDERLTARFVEKALEVLDQERALQEGGEKVVRGKYKGVDTVRLGHDLHAARIGPSLLLGSSEVALHAGIDQGAAGTGVSGVAAMSALKDARKLLPADPLAWGWVNLEPVKKQAEAKKLFEQPRNNFVLTFLFAGVLDAVRRSPYIAFGLHSNSDGGLLATVRLPAGRANRGGDVVLHLPDDPKAPGTLPLLEPRGVAYSHSFYQDLGALWEKRSRIMNAKHVKSFEEGEQQASRFLPGGSLGKLFAQSGPYWRIVSRNGDGKSAYGIQPGTRVGEFAVVLSMRDKAFARSIETMIRGGAVLAGFQISGLTLFEEQLGDVRLFGYRFSEKAPFDLDVDNLRFNFVPTFAAVDDQYVLSSSLGLCKDLVAEIRKQAGAPARSQNMRLRVYADGTAQGLSLTPDQLITQAILGDGVSEADARKQADAFVRFLSRLGMVTFETDYAETTFRFDVNWQPTK